MHQCTFIIQEFGAFREAQDLAEHSQEVWKRQTHPSPSALARIMKKDAKGEEAKALFFLSQWAVAFFVFSYLKEFTVLRSYWASVRGNESGNEFVYTSVSGCFAFLLLWMNTSDRVCVFVCFAMLLCVFLERVPRVRHRHLLVAH